MAFQTGSKIGVDLTQSQTSAQFGLGDRVNGSGDSLWVYVIANGAISTGDCVMITSSGTATRATGASVQTVGYEVGFAQFAFADGEYGWVARNGMGLTVAVSATTSGSAVLYIGTTSGKLSNTSSSGTLVGVQIVTTSATATYTTTTGHLSWPRCAAAGI